MSFPPTVLYPLTLPGLLRHILTTQSNTATTLIICSSREIFLQDLLQSLQQETSEEQGRDDSTLQDLVTPSLHNLFTTRHIKLAFCGSVQGLLAFWTAYGRVGQPNALGGQTEARLILVNPLALHATTPSFSAQGLSRTFAAATETTLRTGAILQVVECQVKHSRRDYEDDEDDEDDTNMTNERDNEHVSEEGEQADPWEQDVSILNVSVRRFGSNSSERAWAGRTVKAKHVAARWFRFQKLGHETRDGLG